MVTVPSVQGSPPVCLTDEDIYQSILPPATPGGDTDGGGHQEV